VPIEETPLAELRLLTGELAFLLSLGPLEMTLAKWSSEITLIRAAGFVERAQQEIREAQRKAETKPRGGRRRR
jgi:hypothetical protein